MARKSFVLLLMGAIIFFLCSFSSADVPHLINYQGKLTTTQGGCLNDTVFMTFSIYPDTLGSPADWTEDQDTVIVKQGIFNVLLGSVNPITASVFDGSTKYLGVQVESDPEMRPLKPMVSVPYAYRAGSGGGEVDCHDCDTVFVNVYGPDSVVATTGTAFLGKVSGNSAGMLFGITGHAENSSTGTAIAGYFLASSPGTGRQYGVRGYAAGNSSSSSYGIDGTAVNTSSGNAYGGDFYTASVGTGTHYGIHAVSQGASSSTTYGTYSEAENTSSGVAYGGYFKSSSLGTGSHYGIYASAYGASSNPTFGADGFAQNTSTGIVCGGHFSTSHSGTGFHYGITASGLGASSRSTFGVDGFAENTSSGDAYAGYFFASDAGTGTKYGVYASAPVDKGYAGYFAGDVKITDSLIVLGAKSVALKVDDGEYRLLYCQESPENWFEDFGEGRLLNGKAVIQIDPLFAQTVNTSVKYHVFLTPQDEPLTLAVANKTTASFEVIGPSGASIPFSYRIVAKRKGYENIRLAKMGGPTPEEVAEEQAKHQAELEEERAGMEQERQKMEQERMNMEKEREKERESR